MSYSKFDESEAASDEVPCQECRRRDNVNFVLDSTVRDTVWLYASTNLTCHLMFVQLKEKSQSKQQEASSQQTGICVYAIPPVCFFTFFHLNYSLPAQILFPWKMEQVQIKLST